MSGYGAVEGGAASHADGGGGGSGGGKQRADFDPLLNQSHSDSGNHLLDQTRFDTTSLGRLFCVCCIAGCVWCSWTGSSAVATE